MNERDILLAYMAAHPKATQAQVGKAFEISQPTVNRVLNGSPDVRQSTIERIRRNAKTLELLHGRSSLSHIARVAILGVCGMGEAIEWVDDETCPLGHVDVPFEISDGAFALEARGDSQFPRIRNGDLVIVQREHEIAEVMNDEAVVKVADGAYLLKTVLPGYEPGTFNLESHNAPMMRNVQIERAFSIQAIIPRRRWTHR